MKATILGAIAGDIIGSPYEARPIKSESFPLFSPASRFTDDTVMTVAVADVLLHGGSYAESYRKWGRRFPDAGYGELFQRWLHTETTRPYNSYGNGSAMRVSPVGFLCKNLHEVLEEAKGSAAVTHSHPEGIRGAQATAAAVFMARNGSPKEEIHDYVVANFGYDLSRMTGEIRLHYLFDPTCSGSVPEAITCFLESRDYEDAIRKSVSLGGDSDTLACIAGGIAAAFYGEIGDAIAHEALRRLSPELRTLVREFEDGVGVQ